MYYLLWTLALLAALALALAPGWGLADRVRLWRSRRYRRLIEDALKHLLALGERGQTGSSEALAGALSLGPRAVIRLIERLESRGLVESSRGGVALTPKGKRWAVQIVRAHRLWERYLADETEMKLEDIHSAAERVEHDLTADKESLDELDARLGYPRVDPHGDPIPDADGKLETLDAIALTDWHGGTPARIAHIEDEPKLIFRQITGLPLAIGDTIHVVEQTPERIVISHQGKRHSLAPVVAANINVRPAEAPPKRPADEIPLADLPDEAEAVVVRIDSQLRGFARRRLLDLGLTPGTRLRVALDNAFGDPRAYRVRGTLIALRQDQSCNIWVRPVESEAEVSAKQAETA